MRTNEIIEPACDTALIKKRARVSGSFFDILQDVCGPQLPLLGISGAKHGFGVGHAAARKPQIVDVIGQAFVSDRVLHVGDAMASVSASCIDADDIKCHATPCFCTLQMNASGSSAPLRPQSRYSQIEHSLVISLKRLIGQVVSHERAGFWSLRSTRRFPCASSTQSTSPTRTTTSR